MKTETRPTIDRERSVLRRVRILGTDAKHAAGLAGAIVHVDPSGGPTKISETIGVLERVTTDSDGALADAMLYRNHPQTPPVFESFERGLGLFGLRVVRNPETGHRRVEVAVVDQATRSATRLEQAQADGRLQDFWAEPQDNAMQRFWAKP
jgi:hypothetical protein